MSCSSCQKNIRAWLRGELSGDEAVAVEQHVSECYFCAVIVERETSLLEALQAQYRVPGPSEGFQERVLAAATSQSHQGARPILSLPVAGGAIAAALVIGIAIGTGLRPGDSANSERLTATSADPENAAPAKNLETVRLMFNTVEAMEDVMLTVELPSHVEVSGYPGYQQLSWNVSLDQGENIVKLPLNVLFPGEGQLVARLSDGGREKVFRTQLSQTDADSLPESEL